METLTISTTSGNNCAMFGRRKSLDENQTVLSNFVKGEKIIKKITGKSPCSNTSQKHTSTPGSLNASPSRKRIRPLSPNNNSDIESNKRAHLDKEMENNTTEDHDTSTVLLNPELTELKRQIFAGFETLLAPIKKEIKELKDDHKTLFEGQTTTCAPKIERKFVQSEERQKKLESRISRLEDQLLEKNVIFQGVHEEEYEDKSDIKAQIVKAIANTMDGDDYEAKKSLAGQTSIDSVERVGKYNPLRIRPVKVKFREKKDVDHLFKNRKKLPRGVYIDKEYSRTTEKERRLLRPVLHIGRKMEKYKGNIRMDGPHLVVNGKHYHRQNLHTLPDDLDPVLATSKEDDTIIGFFGELHPFSNFHPCKFTIEGLEFHSSEQFIQMKKAEYFNDNIARERILNSEDAQDCKEISKDINHFNKKSWNAVAKEMCEPGITEKFVQNRNLLSYLMDTGNKTIVEASFDDLWGTGSHISSKDALNKNKWRGTNILGKILMGIRDKQVEPFLTSKDPEIMEGILTDENTSDQ